MLCEHTFRIMLYEILGWRCLMVCKMGVVEMTVALT